jgi:uncharacterized membrane protein YgcG
LSKLAKIMLKETTTTTTTMTKAPPGLLRRPLAVAVLLLGMLAGLLGGVEGDRQLLLGVNLADYLGSDRSERGPRTRGGRQWLPTGRQSTLLCRCQAVYEDLYEGDGPGEAPGDRDLRQRQLQQLDDQGYIIIDGITVLPDSRPVCQETRKRKRAAGYYRQRDRLLQSQVVEEDAENPSEVEEDSHENAEELVKDADMETEVETTTVQLHEYRKERSSDVETATAEIRQHRKERSLKGSKGGKGGKGGGGWSSKSHGGGKGKGGGGGSWGWDSKSGGGFGGSRGGKGGGGSWGWSSGRGKGKGKGKGKGNPNW